MELLFNQVCLVEITNLKDGSKMYLKLICNFGKIDVEELFKCG